MAAPQRPLSPFMIGPYYRPQITSVLSITHRITGVILALAALGLTAWLLAVAGGSAAFETFQAFAGSPVGQLLLIAVAAALVFHFLNGIRHLLWDVGWGFELPRVYASGYVVLGLTAVITAAIAYVGLNAGGGA